MIASLRGLAILAAITVALAVAVLLHRGPPPIDHAVLPAFTGDAHELHWQRAVGDMTAVHAGDKWLMGTRTLDARAIDAVLDALRGARWHRRAERARAGAIHATLAVDGRQVAIGQTVDGVDQAWLVVGDRALLVDGWVARALEPSGLALVDREPFAEVSSVSELAISPPGVVLAGVPRRTSIGIVAPARAAALVSALDDVQLVRLPTSPASGTTVQLGSAAPIVVGGACAPDAQQLVALHAATGDGCIEPAAWQAVVTAATALASPDSLDPRPAGFPLDRVGSLDLGKPGHDPERVAELVAALAAPGQLVALPKAAPKSSLVVAPKGGAPITLDIYPDAVARHGEPRAIRVTPNVLAVLARPASAYADTTRWAEDPSVVSRLVVDGVTYDRGAVVGEWHRTPDKKLDPQLVEALATALAHVSAPDAPLPAGFRAAHHVEVTLAPPVGAKTTHRLELGAPGPKGCAARIDGTPMEAPPELCMAAAAVAR
ncbi:MAG TPA: hypothetical protein VGL61_35405 [Kofleriaceae bacterium]